MEERNCPLCNAPSRWELPQISMNRDARRIVCPQCRIFEIHTDAVNRLSTVTFPETKRQDLVRRSRYFHDAGMTFIITPGNLDIIPF